jgi:hypothetical protein
MEKPNPQDAFLVKFAERFSRDGENQPPVEYH